MALKMINLGNVYDNFLEASQKHAISRLEAVLPVSRVRAAIEASSVHSTKAQGEKSGNGNRIPGRVQIANMVRLLDKLGYTRSATQKEIHKGMIASVLPRIFQHESDTEMKLAMQDYGLKETSQQFMVLCPRRHGKTVVMITLMCVCFLIAFCVCDQATALFIAAYLLSIPSCTVSVYSTARRASQELLNMIKKMVATLPMSRTMQSISNQETFELNINGDKRRCSSYPGCSRTLRGTGGDLIVLEEETLIYHCS